MSGPARWLILPEDGSDHAPTTVHTLARHICARALALPVLPDVEPEAPGADLAGAVKSLNWEQRHFAISLARELATRLRRGELVVLHHDGDTRWSMRKRDKTRAQQFEEKVLRRVEKGLGADWPALRHNLLLLVPYYHIESWLYLNRREIQRLFEEGRVHKEALAQLDRWLAEHDTLDEVEKIGDECRVGKRHNQRLAERQFPAEIAEQKSPSFAATVEKWRDSKALRRALGA